MSAARETVSAVDSLATFGVVAILGFAAWKLINRPAQTIQTSGQAVGTAVGTAVNEAPNVAAATGTATVGAETEREARQTVGSNSIGAMIQRLAEDTRDITGTPDPGFTENDQGQFVFTTPLRGQTDETLQPGDRFGEERFTGTGF